MAAKWISFKETVRIGKFNEQSLRFFDAIVDTAPPLQGDTVVVTSVNDSAHRPASAHYSNDGWDIRTHPSSMNPNRLGSIIAVDEQTRDLIAARWVDHLRRRLGSEFDVIYEGDKFHIHGELDRSSV